MIRIRAIAGACALLVAAGRGEAEEVLRVRISVELEKVPSRYLEEPVAEDSETAHRRALEESAIVLGGMVYGWDFDYEIGERARGIAENFTLAERGRIAFGDPRLTVTDAEVEGSKLFIWAEYRPDEAQSRRLKAWRAGEVKPVQGIGSGTLSDEGEGKRTALEDAARAAIRAYLRGTERNRPKEVSGAVALVDHPRYWIDAGRWTAAARFQVVIDEIVPFAAY